ncbi:MAG: DUF99 family protein [Cyanobacteria bacterium]|jgi:endonuclease V-like protein UPF0215 family|nr:DUF99 family protein [Cyanobacteria bacterium GSL.Bin21]
MELASLLRQKRKIRVIGFDDAPFVRETQDKVSIAGVVCAGTRFEGMLWGEIEPDGWDATETISQLLYQSKFFVQLHLVLLDGLGFGGFNLVDLPALAHDLQLPCVALMRRYPKLDKMKAALANLPHQEKRLQRLENAGVIYHYPPFFFQVSGEEPQIIAQTLECLTDCGKVPEALRLAHLIGAAVMKGESGSQA